MKKTTLSLIRFTAIAVLALSMFSCGEDPVPEPTVQVFSSVDGYQVAFTATATNTDSYAWDFGDGESSTEQNPVHVYAQSGTYTATVTVTGEGGTASGSAEVTISASELEMLTGGPEMANGKTWTLSPTASEGDGIYYADADMTVQEPIPDGILGLIGLPTEYEDEFTFKNDLSYSHDTKNDSVVADIIFAMANQLGFRQSDEDIIVLAPFTPAAATFTYTEDTDLTLEVIPDQDLPEESTEITWSGVTVLEIAGGEFVGIMDFTRKYIVFDISVDHVQIGMFISTTQGSKANMPTHFVKMTLIPKQ
ncbi:MAG: PKD domain-containing protein [Bacteroidota bacterium]